MLNGLFDTGLDSDRKSAARAERRHANSSLFAIELEINKWSFLVNRIYEDAVL